MLGLDESIAGLGTGSLALALAVAVLLGLRHATDPDHLTAVAALIAGDRHHGARRARQLGLAWGAGHGVTLFAVGMPLLLAGRVLPEPVQQAAELLIGLLICVLALRLLGRWRSGAFHSHPHRHGDVWHAHPHRHALARAGGGHDAHLHTTHDHAHAEVVGRTPRAAFAIGLVHGVGGSAGAGIVMVGATAQGAPAVGALVAFATCTALSMALVSAWFGGRLVRGAAPRRLARAVPAMGTASLVFGAWYVAAALRAAPYPF